jgi:phosphodiesterase/alkaline phosphatase D-like protein
MSYPLIVCGPIIGTVTDSTARILIEVDQDCEIIMKLYSNDNTYKVKKSLMGKIPTIFKFEDLKSNTKHFVGFDHQVCYENKYLANISSSFKTLSDDLTNTKFAVISCNAISKELQTNKEYSLWKHLSENIDKYDYALHLGDQVYLDWGEWFGDEENVYQKVKKLLHNADPDSFDKYSDEVRGLIRSEYLRTFNYEYVARVYRNIPNFMIFDDHEFYDNFAFFEINDETQSSKIDRFFAKHARWYYYAYQKQLWEDIDFPDFKTVKKEYHYMTINQVGLFFVDRRGCRYWHKNPGDQLKLGSEQWQDLENCFKKGGTFDKQNIKTVFLVTTTPIVLMAHSVVLEIYGMTQKEIYEQWSYDCPEEQVRLLKLMKEFREATNKEVVLVSGDVHMAGCTDIYHNDKFVYKQFIASGIMQRSLTAYQVKMANFAFDFKENLDGGFSFNHKNFTPHNNYGIIDVYDDNSIYCNWVKSLDTKKYLPTLGEPVYYNYINKQRGGRCSCCNII